MATEKTLWKRDVTGHHGGPHRHGPPQPAPMVSPSVAPNPNPKNPKSMVSASVAPNAAFKNPKPKFK